MFDKKTKKPTIQSVRNRRPAQPGGETFRRNAVVFSKAQKELAQAQQSVTQRQIARQRAAAARRYKIKAAAVLLMTALALLAFRMNLSSVALETNASSKLTTTDGAAYQTAIQSLYNSHTIAGQWWLADTEAIGAEIMGQFSEIERVTLGSNAPFSSKLKADVRFRKAVFTWLDASGQSQFVDKNGVLFTKNLDPSVNTNKLIKIEDQSGVVIDSGNAVLTRGVVQFIGQLHNKLPPLYPANSKIIRVIIPTSTREVQVQVSGQPYIIKFNSVRDIDEQIGELGALLNHTRSKNINPAQYIDMRVPHKAFYK